MQLVMFEGKLLLSEGSLALSTDCCCFYECPLCDSGVFSSNLTGLTIDIQSVLVRDWQSLEDSGCQFSLCLPHTSAEPVNTTVNNLNGIYSFGGDQEAAILPYLGFGGLNGETNEPIDQPGLFGGRLGRFTGCGIAIVTPVCEPDEPDNTSLMRVEVGILETPANSGMVVRYGFWRQFNYDPSQPPKNFVKYPTPQLDSLVPDLVFAYRYIPYTDPSAMNPTIDCTQINGVITEPWYYTGGSRYVESDFDPPPCSTTGTPIVPTQYDAPINIPSGTVTLAGF